MNQLLDKFIENTQQIMNIQPYAHDSLFVYAFVLLSLLFLGAIVAILQWSKFRFFESFFPFLLSEQYSLGYYKYKLTYSILDVLLALFFVLQIAFFAFRWFPKHYFPVENVWLQFAIFFGAIALLYLVKLFAYSSLKHLLPTRVDVSYLGFNYAYWCFYFGVFMFLINLLNLTGSVPQTVVLPITLVAIFYLFFIVRLISLSLRYKILGSLYVLLYLCALEIAPLLFLLSKKVFF